MTFNEKAIGLYSYIVGGVSTTRMSAFLSENYGIRIGKNEFNPVLAEYGLNYNDRGTGNVRGFGDGQHLGAYSGGYQTDDGQVYEIDLNIIKDYMNTYKRKRLNLEQYLDMRFNGGGVGFGFDFSGILSKLIPVAVITLVIFFGYNMLFGGNKKDSRPTVNNGELSEPVATHSYTTKPQDKNYGNTAFGDISNDDGTAHFGLVVSFKGEESDMVGVEDYYVCIGSEESKTKLTIGGMCSGDINLPVGKIFKLWVVSGDMKSDVYRVEIGPKGGTIYFDCTVGEGGRPNFVNTSVLGQYLWVEKVE